MSQVPLLLRSPGFWSIPACAALLVVLFIEQVHIIQVSTQSNGRTILQCALAGTATAGLIVVAHRLAPWVRRNRIPAPETIGALCLIGVARTWPQWGLTPASDLSPALWYPILQSTVFTVIIGLLIGLTSARVTLVVNSMRQESAARVGLAERKFQTAVALSQTRNAMHDWAQAVVVPAVNESITDLDALADDRRRIAGAAHDAAQNLRARAAEVRDASHQLDAASHEHLPEPPVDVGTGSETTPLSVLNGLGAQFVTGSPFHPFLIPSVAVVCALGTVYRLAANTGTLVLAFTTIAAFLYLCQRVVTPLLRRFPIGVQIAIVICGYALAGLAACTMIVLRYGLGDPATGIRFILLTIGLVTTVAVVVGLSAACVRQLGVSERETAAMTASAEWELARYESQLAAMTEAVSEALHSEIQGRLVLVALLLDDLAPEAAASGEQPERQLSVITSATQSLSEARDDVVRISSEGNGDDVSLTDGLTQLVALWSPPLTIDLHLPHPDMFAHDQAPDATTRTLLLRAVRDAVANAARHGAARHLSISVQQYGRTIVVDDDGVGVPESIAPQGLSYQHFIAAGGSWTYSTSELGGIKVTLNAPESTVAPAATGRVGH